MRSIAIIILLSASVAAGVNAAEPVNPESVRGIACWPEPAAPLISADLSEVIEMTTGDADIDGNGDARFTGPITMRSRNISLQADSALYDSKSASFIAEGGIEFSDGAGKVTGESVSYDTRNGVFTFSEGAFELPVTPARGSAATITVSRAGFLNMEKVRYTSCPAGNNGWLLKAKSITIDGNEGVGTARGATLAFKGVPFIYLPYFSYPVTDDRKSGLLFPKLGSGSQRGFELEVPYYWNIRPNMDATFIPRYMDKRGLQLGTEYRFLSKAHEGLLWGDYLSDDKQSGIDRWRYEIETESMLPWGWRSTIEATGVSDNNYFEDLSSNRQKTSQTNLDKHLDIERYTDTWSLFFRAQDFQTIDDAIQPEDLPYAQLPQFVADGTWHNGLLGMDYKLGTEAVYFYREEVAGVEAPNGARVHVQPEIALPLGHRGLYLNPEVALDYTAYQLQNQAVGDPDNPSRAIPIASIDTGAVFDKLAGKSGGFMVTLEPRAQYTYIPYEDQSDMPIFDTISPDFNLVQLFRKNRYIGYDRLGDTNQLSVGITSRILSSVNGRELMSATLGQTRFYETGEVTLPGEIPGSTDASNYVAQLNIKAWENWSAGMGLQWDSENNQTDRSSIRMQYRPGERKAINAAYRYVRDSLEQTDFSFAWPLGTRWSAIGRYNYSIQDNQALDRFAGLEYESCCWAIRLVGRRSVSRSTGESDSSVSFQFELKGFSNLGSSTSADLERDILDNWTRRNR